MKKFFKLFFLFFFIVSCDRSTIDYDNNLSRKEVKERLIKGRKTPSQVPIISNNVSIPNISKLLVAPPPPPMGNGELISFSVTEEVPIKDVLIELGRLAEVDIEIDPNITGGIILKITKKPLNVVVKRISELANLRWSYTNNILRFEKDLPYTKTYYVDFLIENDVWGSIETSLNEIIDINRVDEENVKEPKLIVNKNAGLITIFANQKTQNASERYIKYVKDNYSSQVLIEAKVVEVSLSDEYSAGIDWSFMNTRKSSTSNVSFNTNLTNQSTLGGVFANFTDVIHGNEISSAISALQKFGLTKTLSSPRIHAMNNQKAELKFVNKLIYFSIEKEEEENGTDPTGKKLYNTTYTATKEEEEEGVTLEITPSIDMKNNEVTLNVIPELKSKIDEVIDPTNNLNKVPVIQTKNIKTSMKVKSGNVLVIGGLMSENTTNQDTGIPILSSIPLIGLLFKTQTQNKKLVENVIFIKATIIKPNGKIKEFDRNIHDFVGNKDEFLD